MASDLCISTTGKHKESLETNTFKPTETTILLMI